MKNRKTSRRDFLSKSTMALTALPFAPLVPLLKPMEARAATGVAPLRLITVYSLYQMPECFYHPQISSTNSAQAPAGSNFYLNYPSSILGPLAPFQSDLIIFRGINYAQMTTPNDPLNTSHSTFPTTFTGSKVALPSNGPTTTGTSIENYLFSRMKQAGGLTPFLAGPFAYHCDNPNSGTASWNNGVESNNIGNPVALYNALFGNFSKPGGAASAITARRQQTLGLVQNYLSSVIGRVPATSPSASMLNSHLAAAQALSSQLGSSSSGNLSCSPPTVSSLYNYTAGDYPGCAATPMPTAARLFSDFTKVITQAMACDITRFCSLSLGDGPDGVPDLFTPIINQMPGLSSYVSHRSPDDFHGTITHGLSCEPTDPQTITLGIYKRYFMTQIANLLTALKAIPDPYNTTQSLYDNTVVLIGNEGPVQRRILGNDGNYYTADGHGADIYGDKPYIIAGGCGGYFKKGQLIFAGGNTPAPGSFAPPVTVPHNAILTNIINAFEKNQQQFNPAYVPKIITQFGDFSFSVSSTTWLS